MRLHRCFNTLSQARHSKISLPCLFQCYPSHTATLTTCMCPVMDVYQQYSSVQICSLDGLAGIVVQSPHVKYLLLQLSMYQVLELLTDLAIGGAQLATALAHRGRHTHACFGVHPVCLTIHKAHRHLRAHTQLRHPCIHI